MLTIQAEQVGPARPQGAAVPPVSMLLNGYVLAYDEAQRKAVYLCGPAYDGFGEAYAFDGEGWESYNPTRIGLSGEGLFQGDYDSSRKGVVCWQFGYDYETEKQVPGAILVRAKESKELTFTGEMPELGDEDLGSWEASGAFAFDRKRELWVCLTRVGVWELSKKGVWGRAAEATELPTKWRGQVQGVWDPVGERCVFAIFEGDDYTYRFFSWDGSRLEELPSEGLPQKRMHFGLFDPSAMIFGHPDYGLALLSGSSFFRVTDDGFEAIDEEYEGGPPQMKNGHAVYDPVNDMIVVGPGFHDGDSGGSDMQPLYYAFADECWELCGVKEEDSPIKKASYGNSRHVFYQGDWYATGTHSLQTWRWRPETGWVELVDKKAGEKLCTWGLLQLHADAESLYAIAEGGAVFEWTGKAWKPRCKASKIFKERSEYITSTVEGELFAWGGEVKNRKSNHSFVFRDDQWVQFKKTSPKPVDFKANRDGPFVDFSAVYDTALDAVVRFGYEEVALWDGEVWEPKKVSKYKVKWHSREYHHIPVHDPESGETLLIDLEALSVRRFDLKGCVSVAQIELPEVVRSETESRDAYHDYTNAFAFDAVTRTLYTQVLDDRYGTYAWRLGPAFAAAAKLGARKIPGAKKSKAEPASKPAPKKKAKAGSAKTTKSAKSAGKMEPVSLYVVDDKQRKFWRIKVVGKKLVREWGQLGTEGQSKTESASSPAEAQAKAAKLAAAKRKQGYVPGAKLTKKQIAEIACVRSQALKVGKAIKGKTKKVIASRMGGEPTGVSKKGWPRADGEPMGFLLQLETGDLLKKHAGVAVFCVTDGTATEDESNNAALLLKKGAFSKAPTPTPEGASALKVRPMTLAKPQLEIDEEETESLSAADPDFAEALERFHESSKVQDASLYSKLGGLPLSVQSDVGREGFLFQLDFDTLSSLEWPDAGLFGCLYVFVDSSEKSATAMWQYT
jgi:predicted DNA-binding WGR domain protein